MTTEHWDDFDEQWNERMEKEFINNNENDDFEVRSSDDGSLQSDDEMSYISHGDEFADKEESVQQLLSNDDIALYQEIKASTICGVEDDNPNCFYKYDDDMIMPVYFKFNGSVKGITQSYKRNYIAGIIQSSLVLDKEFAVDAISPSNRKKRKRRLNDEENYRQYCKYTVFNKSMCLVCFMKLFNCSRSIISGILQQFKKEGVGIHQPLHKGKKPGVDTLKQSVINWIKLHAYTYALPCPSASRNIRKSTDTLLFFKRGTLRANIYKQYKEAYNNTQYAVSLNYFCKIWNQWLPNIRIMQNGTDFCDTCTTLIERRQSEEIQQALLTHRALAKKERLYYVQQCKLTDHITIDMAQSVYLPFFLRQPGSYYFKAGRTVRVFGVCNEKKKIQTNYLYPEGSFPTATTSGGTRSSFTISLLNDYLNNNPSNNVHIHANSCSGQNKSKFLFYYLIWRVLIKQNELIEISFMVPGHTNAEVDSRFVYLKRKLSKDDCIHMEKLVEVVNESCIGNYAIDGSKHSVKFYDWKQFLLQYFRKTGIPGIKHKYMNMVIQRDEKDDVVVLLKRCSDDADGVLYKKFFKEGCFEKLVRCDVYSLQLFIKQPTPMSNERKKYLIESVAEEYLSNHQDKYKLLGLENEAEYEALKVELDTGSVLPITVQI